MEEANAVIFMSVKALEFTPRKSLVPRSPKLMSTERDGIRKFGLRAKYMYEILICIGIKKSL